MTEGSGDGGKLEKAAGQFTNAVRAFVLDGGGPLTGAAAYANDRSQRLGDPEKAINRLIKETVAATTTTGFVTSLGGLATLPAAVPANLAGSALFNARMVGGIAHLRGWDLADEMVLSAVLVVAAGGSASEALRSVGVKVGQKLTLQAIEKVPIETIRAVNRKAGFMLLAKYGTSRATVTLAKAVPIVGGVVGGTVDGAFTKALGTAAKRAFPVVEPAAGDRV